MSLDLFSLLVAAVLVVCVMAAAHLAVWHRDRGETTLLWIVGSAMLGCAGGILRELAPETVAIFAANVAILASLGAMGQACRSLGGRPPSLPWLLLPPALWVVACCLPQVFGDRELRIVIASAISFLYTVWAFDELWQDRAERLSGRLWLRAILLVNAAGAFGRMVVTELFRGEPQPGLAPSAGIAIVTLWSLAYVLLVGCAMVATILERSRRALHRQAGEDALTGLSNRRQFDRTLEAAHETALATRQPLALVLIDADAFKAFNDRYGHVAGDDCLRVIAGVLAAAAPAPDHVARIGGEEFAVLLPGAGPQEAMRWAEAAREALQARAIPHAGSAHGRVTVSFGTAVAGPGAGGDIRGLMERADGALYAAKRSGRDRVEAASTRDDVRHARLAA